MPLYGSFVPSLPLTSSLALFTPQPTDWAFTSRINFAQLTAGGGWAVVTGATDGLGLAYAKELAKRGANVMLVGRHPEKLDMVAREIEAQFRVKADMLVIDFQRCSLEDYLKVKDRLSRLRCDILVNSVGMASGSTGSFGCQSNTEQMCLDLLNVNIIPTLMFTNAVLPGMKERKRGVIVNLSSVAAVYPLPNYALYGATKSFVDFFSSALDRECRPFSIFVQCVLAGPVLSNMTKSQAKSFFIVQPGPFVREALSQVGLRRRTFGHWIHAVMVSIAQPFPLWMTLRFLQPKNRS
ncbi:putative Very-long-chain 3-oxoacyl-CoA reductase [Hypsibius exemplaris]|uniref:Very-long-chain 3-oxoacyl-CoA reductase n=1 Tax=Hypsibius exemplaris TaxID=2072580 RepID=A0A1W0X8X4_HYPEX|nr:putative Very-long-chain 3-oxoacyl-CoA reductase [Hypsibius exemplaris]